MRWSQSITTHALLADTTEAQFDALVNVHFNGVFFLVQKLLPLLADGGRIVNVSSGPTRYRVEELRARGIAVNTVAPGAIATDFGGGNRWINAQRIEVLGGRSRCGNPLRAGCTRSTSWQT